MGSRVNPLLDLDLLMDHNILLATSKPQPTHEHEHELDLANQSTTQPHLHPEIVPPQEHAPSPPPLPAAASLSLAFSSMLSSNVLLSQFGAIRPPHNRVSPNPARASRAGVALPSQKKSINPAPLVPAITAAVGVGVSSASLATVSKKGMKSITAFPDYLRLPDKHKNFSDPGSGAVLRRASIVWFRNDLRLHDNEALSAANNESLSILPVYCFDPRDYGKSSSGFDKTGPYRAKFLLECVANLRENLKARGSDLVVRIGKPEDVLLSLAKDIGADALYAHLEVSADEIQSENNVSAALKEQGVETKFFWGSTLYHMDDLPFKLEQMPTTYSGFREKVQDLNIRSIIEAPSRLKSLPVRGGVKPGDIPTLQDLRLNPLSLQRQDGQANHGPALVGGEEEALRRLESFATEHLKQASDEFGSHARGDSLYGANFSCKISPWLAMGCLSPRRMFEDLNKKGKSVVSASSQMAADNKGLSWLVFELLWRDFFRFITKKYGSSKKISDVAPATACMGAAA